MDKSVKKIFIGLGTALFAGMALLIWFVISVFVSSDALFNAAQNNDLQMARKLLASGVPATTTEGDFSTPVLYAAANHDAGNVELVKLLLQHGANANQATTEKRTPLQMAASHGNVEVMKLLMSHGAEVDTATEVHFPTMVSRETALTIAAHDGHAEAVKLLLAHGADANTRTSEGRTALQEAKTNTHNQYKEVVALLRMAAKSSSRKDSDAPTANGNKQDRKG